MNAPPRLRVYAGGLLASRVRRILTLAGWNVATGWPRADDAVGVWGHSPRAWRGERIAAATDRPLVRIEDAFLRSLHPGRLGEPPLGLLIDPLGVHFDPERPSNLENLIQNAGPATSARLTRARDLIDRLKRGHLTKYAATVPDMPLPPEGFVLVIDQTRGDASLRYGGAPGPDPAPFDAMLSAARREHPGAHVVIRTHPETARGLRPGLFRPDLADERTTLFSGPASPWALFDRARAVYTISSQMGFEAILAGHRPRVFGRPFYAGWGLTDDEHPIPRRTARPAPEDLALAALVDAPTWYDPFRDRLCEVEDIADFLSALSRAWREDRNGHVASGMRLWKRRPLQRTFGRERPLIFRDDPDEAAALARSTGRSLLVWAGREAPGHLAAPRVLRVEDGLIRSRGLGAQLVPALSLVTDDTGIYYDPTRPSRLEALIAESTGLPGHAIARAERLIELLTARGLTKYNLGGPVPDLPPGHRILVPGQVEDDASILKGAAGVRTNAALLAAVRAAHPNATILYKPHPDVEAGLRPGAIDAADADLILRRANPAELLPDVAEVWTMTSALGFEAIVRGVPVTCLGTPFYAGWGLTRDLVPPPERRTARPSLPGLVHATLIDYPRYMDPVTGEPCPPEVAMERLSEGAIPSPGAANRALSKLQGLMASRAHLWRRD